MVRVSAETAEQTETRLHDVLTQAEVVAHDGARCFEECPADRAPELAADTLAVVRDKESCMQDRERLKRESIAAREEIVARNLRAYRPHLAAGFGERITARIMDSPEVVAFAIEMYELLEWECDEAAEEAARYSRDHPVATASEAFAAVLDRAFS